MSSIWQFSFVRKSSPTKIFSRKDLSHNAISVSDDDKCGKLCDDILDELENIDDDTDKHGIQFVKSKDSKLASEIGIFSFPALVYYETGVPIMYDGKCSFAFLCKKKTKKT